MHCKNEVVSPIYPSKVKGPHERKPLICREACRFMIVLRRNLQTKDSFTGPQVCGGLTVNTSHSQFKNDLADVCWLDISTSRFLFLCFCLVFYSFRLNTRCFLVCLIKNESLCVSSHYARVMCVKIVLKHAHILNHRSLFTLCLTRQP